MPSKMKKTLTKVSLFLSFVLLLSSLLPLKVSATNQQLEANLNQEVSAAYNRLQQKKQQVANLRTSTVQVTQRLKDLEVENEELKKQYEEIQEQLNAALEALEVKQKAYAEALELAMNKRNEYNYRLATMFYYYKKSPWEILLESKGLEGFFTNMRMMNLIATADKKALDDLILAETVARQAESEADKVMKEYQAFADEKQREIDQLEAGILNATSQLSQMNAILSTSSHDISQLEADLAQKQAAYAAFKEKEKNYNITFAGGGAIWPLPASSEVSSPYGARFMAGDRSNNNVHTGTDFGGAGIAGTPVVAAWAGYVTNVHYPYPGAMYAPDANYVQITHGDGVGTGYWHLQTITVSEGQFVAQGTMIGTCGSTGYSTGPHLHFEVYNKNSPNRGIRDTIDPMSVLGR